MLVWRRIVWCGAWGGAGRAGLDPPAATTLVTFVNCDISTREPDFIIIKYCWVSYSCTSHYQSQNNLNYCITHIHFLSSAEIFCKTEKTHKYSEKSIISQLHSSLVADARGKRISKIHQTLTHNNQWSYFAQSIFALLYAGFTISSSFIHCWIIIVIQEFIFEGCCKNCWL